MSLSYNDSVVGMEFVNLVHAGQYDEALVLLPAVRDLNVRSRYEVGHPTAILMAIGRGKEGVMQALLNRCDDIDFLVDLEPFLDVASYARFCEVDEFSLRKIERAQMRQQNGCQPPSRAHHFYMLGGPDLNPYL